MGGDPKKNDSLGRVYPRSVRAAVIQLNCTSDREANWQQVETCAREAAADGALLITTPENTNFLGPHEQKVATAEPLDGPTASRFAALAADLGVYFLLGSFNEVGPDSNHCYNTSVLYAPDGSRVAVYRKIHLFDVDIADEGQEERVRFMESDTVAPGREVVVAGIGDDLRLGMSVCYDLRFGELFRAQVATNSPNGGANVIALPSAFTARTGKDHWRPLIRARAIETQCWWLAPAQTGRHDDQGLRHSHGHSMIVDPWGAVVAEIADGVGWIAADLDLDQVAKVRRAIPVQQHRANTGL